MVSAFLRNYANPWDGQPYFVFKQAFETRTSTTLADDAELTFNLFNGTYYFRIGVDVLTSAPIKCALASTGGGLTVKNGQALRKDSGTGNLVFETTTSSITNIAASSAFSWWGFFTIVNLDDTVSFQWACNTAGSGTINANSYLWLTRI